MNLQIQNDFIEISIDLKSCEFEFWAICKPLSV